MLGSKIRTNSNIFSRLQSASGYKVHPPKCGSNVRKSTDKACAIYMAQLWGSIIFQGQIEQQTIISLPNFHLPQDLVIRQAETEATTIFCHLYPYQHAFLFRFSSLPHWTTCCSTADEVNPQGCSKSHFWDHVLC